MFCVNCGESLNDQAKFCTRCGSRVGNQNMNYHNQNENYHNQNMQMQNAGMQVVNELYRKEKVGLYIWIAIICYQVLIGFVFPSSWACALWNIFACYQSSQFCQRLIQYPVGIYKHYEEALTTDIIFIILNLFLGGVLGAAVGIYDLYVRQYAMNNRDILLYVENSIAK